MYNHVSTVKTRVAFGDYISSNIYTDMIVFCFLEINRRELFKFAAIPHNYGLNNHEKRADSVIAISSFLLARTSLDIVFYNVYYSKSSKSNAAAFV